MGDARKTWEVALGSNWESAVPCHAGFFMDTGLP